MVIIFMLVTYGLFGLFANVAVTHRANGPDNYNSFACPGSIGTKRTGMRFSR